MTMKNQSTSMFSNIQKTQVILDMMVDFHNHGQLDANLLN